METNAIEKPADHTSAALFTPTRIPVPALPGGFSKRKLKKVRNQLEFYFCPSNLLKDRYLQRHMSPPMDQQQSDLGCGYVELDLVSKFGLMKELTGGSVEAVRRGAELSSHLELSEDRKRVRRKEPISPLSEEEVTLRTIYIEQIPPKMNSQQALHKLFSKYGTVTYVSLPHYRTKKTGRGKQVSIPKGFAFVEFSSPLAVTRVVSAFQPKQSGILAECSEAPETKTDTPNDSLTMKQSPPVKFGNDLTNKSSKAEQNRKRRYDVEVVVDEETTGQKVKRNKFDSMTSQATSLPVDSPVGERGSCSASGVAEDVAAVKKKKVRNRLRRKKRSREKKMMLSNGLRPGEKRVITDPIRVMTKSEWLSLKSEFKCAQKKCLGQLKLVNKQAKLEANFRPREEKMDCETKEVSGKRRGSDKILNECIQIAESRFKH